MKDFILKKEFGWTQSELENEFEDDLDAYFSIINIQNQMKQEASSE